MMKEEEKVALAVVVLLHQTWVPKVQQQSQTKQIFSLPNLFTRYIIIHTAPYTPLYKGTECELCQTIIQKTNLTPENVNEYRLIGLIDVINTVM